MVWSVGEVLREQIWRLGAKTGRSVVRYQTDPSPLAGKKFEPVTGSLEFAPGEDMKSFQIPILDDETFHTTDQFGITLFEAEGCELGLHLSRCRVTLLDNDVFPTNRFRKETQDDPTTKSWQRGKSFQMMREYLKFTYEATRAGSRKALLADQFKNLYFVGTIAIQKVLVDDVLPSALQLTPVDLVPKQKT